MPRGLSVWRINSERGFICAVMTSISDINAILQRSSEAILTGRAVIAVSCTYSQMAHQQQAWQMAATKLHTSKTTAGCWSNNGQHIQGKPAMRPDIRASAVNLMQLSHLQALNHGRGSHGCWYGPSKRCSLCLVHSRDIKLDQGSRVAAAGGVGSSTAAAAGCGVIDHLGDDSEGLSRSQT